LPERYTARHLSVVRHPYTALHTVELHIMEGNVHFVTVALWWNWTFIYKNMVCTFLESNVLRWLVCCLVLSFVLYYIY